MSDAPRLSLADVSLTLGGRPVLDDIGFSARAGETLVLEVENDAPDQASLRDPARAGLGLRLLRERLAALYAGRAALDAGPTADGAYRVVLELPCAPPDHEREDDE